MTCFVLLSGLSQLARAAEDGAQSWLKPFLGEWRGTLKCNNPRVRDNVKKVVFLIDSEGNVKGRIGGLEIGKARLERLTGWMHSILKGEYMIWGDLSGIVHQATGKQTFTFFMPFGRRNGEFDGQFHSQGVKRGIEGEFVGNSWRLLRLDRLFLR